MPHQVLPYAPKEAHSVKALPDGSSFLRVRRPSDHMSERAEQKKVLSMHKFASQPMSMLRKKVMKGVESFRNEMLPHKLLPKLSMQRISRQLAEDQRKEQNQIFATMSNELNNSVVFLQHTISQHDEESELLRLQTAKCYRHVPQLYFQDPLPSIHFASLLSKDPSTSRQAQLELADYVDEIELNVSLQVNFKMKVFMTFVTFLSSVGTLAEMSISKIASTRARNELIRTLVVHRSTAISRKLHARRRTTCQIAVLSQLRKMRKAEASLMSQVVVKTKVWQTDLYTDYLEMHEHLKDYCCKNYLCKSRDIAYYLERGYEDSFLHALRNYLLELVPLSLERLSNILQPRKQSYNSTRQVSAVDLSANESIEVEETVELVVKSNIEREIVSLFELGVKACAYCTQGVCQEFTQELAVLEESLFRAIEEHLGQKRPREQLLSTVPLGKYLLLLEAYFSKIQHLLRRTLSIIDQLFRALSCASTLPERSQLISANLMSILVTLFGWIDHSVYTFMSGRVFRDQDTEMMRRVTGACKQLQSYVEGVRAVHAWTWTKLVSWAKHALGDQSASEQEMVFRRFLPQVIRAKECLVDLLFSSYHRKITQKELRSRLESDNWLPIILKPALQQLVGYIMFGPSYLQDLEKKEANMLSSSLLIQRQPSLSQSMLGRFLRSENLDSKTAYDLHISEKYLRVKGCSYRLTASTQSFLEMLAEYLQLSDQFYGAQGHSQHFKESLSSKLIEFVCMYNTHIKSLIVNCEAVALGKIKSKSITGKHLILCYSQLRLVSHVLTALFAQTNRFGQEQTEVGKILESATQKTMGEVVKKFVKILSTSIRDTVAHLQADPKAPIICPLAGTKQVAGSLSKIQELLEQYLSAPDEYEKFLGFPWAQQYLERLRQEDGKVFRFIMKSTGSRKKEDIEWGDNLNWKLKELEYLIQMLRPIEKSVVGFAELVLELQGERRKMLQE